MAAYTVLTSLRSTRPDVASLIAAVRLVDVTAGVSPVVIDLPVGITVKTATPLTAPQLAALQTALDSAPAASSRLSAQATIDSWPLELKALVLALIDQLNVIRAALPVPLGPITPTQALAAVRTKAGTL